MNKKKLYYEPMLDDHGKTMWQIYLGGNPASNLLPPFFVEEWFPPSEWEYIAIKNDEYGEE